MQNLIPFTFEASEIRVLSRDGEPWFILADVCRVLEIGNPSDVARRLDEDEKDTLDSVEGGKINGLGTIGAMPTIINEPGLYSLILTSRKPSAKRFKKWVTAEVLPAIRKTGSYGVTQPALPDLSDPALLQRLLAEHLAKRIEAETSVEAARPKVEFYDCYVNTEGLYGLQNAGRVLGYSPNKFVDLLKGEFLFYQGGALVPKAKYRKFGIFAVKIVEDKGQARLQTFVTPQGVLQLARRFGREEFLTIFYEKNPMIDPTHNEIAAIETGGRMGGEYLDSLGKTDLATLNRQEWLTFITCVVNGYRLEFLRLSASDQTRLGLLTGAEPPLALDSPRTLIAQSH